MDTYEDKLEREREWNRHQAFRQDHFQNSRIFYSPERHAFNYILPRERMRRLVQNLVAGSGLDNPSLLIAPVGTGSDIKYLQPISDNMSGIDISEEAVSKVDSICRTYVGDMRVMTMFPDGLFDFVVTPLFFHHFIRFGFDDFLGEIYRVLKSGGHFVALEPNLLCPICSMAAVAKRIVGNITGAVDDEAPLVPFRLTGAMRRCGFQHVRLYGASFSHNRIPIPVAKLLNSVSYPLLNLGSLGIGVIKPHMVV